MKIFLFKKFFSHLYKSSEAKTSKIFKTHIHTTHTITKNIRLLLNFKIQKHSINNRLIILMLGSLFFTQQSYSITTNVRMTVCHFQGERDFLGLFLSITLKLNPPSLQFISQQRFCYAQGFYFTNVHYHTCFIHLR